MSEECFNWLGMVQKKIECQNLHPKETKLFEFAFECMKCEYVMIRPEVVEENES